MMKTEATLISTSSKPASAPARKSHAGVKAMGSSKAQRHPWEVKSFFSSNRVTSHLVL